MSVRMAEMATDWTNQTYDERLRLCVETLFVHGLIKSGTYRQASDQIRARAEIQREQMARFSRGADHGR